MVSNHQVKVPTGSQQLQKFIIIMAMGTEKSQEHQKEDLYIYTLLPERLKAQHIIFGFLSKAKFRSV